MKIYIIQSALISKESGKVNKFENLWAVESEAKAKSECIKYQIHSNENYSGCSFKFIYKYEEIVLYKES